MKDVSEILAKRLQRLEQPFSREWIADFSNLMEFIQTNSLSSQIVEAIKKDKEEAHKSLILHLQTLLKNGKKCLQEIGAKVDANSVVYTQLQALLGLKIDLKDIASHFFELEAIYNKYCQEFVALLRILAQEDANIFISKYCILSSMKLQDTIHLNIDLSFSPYLQKCKQDIEILSGQRTTSLWGRWDTLLKWAEWTKNGISPTNDAFERNLSHLFTGLKIAETVQSCGLFFLQRLAGMKTVISDSDVCLKAMELYLDKQDQYWIIAHIAGEGNDRQPFFIKKLQRNKRPHKLLKLLLDTESYSPMNFDPPSHTLGELEIKNELKRLFFPNDKFAGPVVHLSEIDYSINAANILEHLSSIRNSKKQLPSFDLRQYIKSSACFC
jgi:hypothetical protein